MSAWPPLQRHYTTKTSVNRDDKDEDEDKDEEYAKDEDEDDEDDKEDKEEEEDDDDPSCTSVAQLGWPLAALLVAPNLRTRHAHQHTSLPEPSRVTASTRDYVRLFRNPSKSPSKLGSADFVDSKVVDRGI